MFAGLSQAYDLLPKGGVLFLREHDKSKTNSIDINLQHIFVSIRITIEHHQNWDLEEVWGYTEDFINSYTSHYQTKRGFIQMCETIGFKLINATLRKVSFAYQNYIDISKTTLFAFQK
jgi:hypothetical protein